MSSSKRGTELAGALAAALRYARAGVRSSQEVRAYLTRREVPSSTIARVLTACGARGLLDDRACARLWVEHWMRRGYAVAAIRERLAVKGLDDQTINEVLHPVAHASSDATRAREVVARRLRGGADARQRSRLARTLASRGFDSDVIERVLGASVGHPAPSPDDQR